MTFSLDSSSLLELLKAPTYRGFILEFIVQRSKVKRLSYSDIARYGGFATRSFPRDVALGSKRITPSSLSKFIKGLGLTADLAEYFRVMVELEESDCRIKISDEFKLQQVKENLKKRILARNSLSLGQTDKAFVLPCIPKVYAALGDLNTGAGIVEILGKTSLGESDALRALSYMVENNLCYKKGRKYFAKELHANFQGLKSEIFRNHFAKSAEESAQLSRKHMNSSEKLFLSSAVSVSKKDLPKLKEELRSVLLRFVDNSENSKGDTVVNLVASLF